MLRVSEWPKQKFIIVVPQKTLARGCLRNFILGFNLIGVSTLLSLIGDSTLLFDICPYGSGGSLMLACCSNASHHSRCLPWVSRMVNELPGSFKVALLFTTYLACCSSVITPNVERSEWSEMI